MLNSIGILIGGANKLGSYLKKLILTFQARVTIDSGSFEGYDCMESLLKQNNKSILDKASLIITPNAYKEGKIYSVVPTDGSGDLSVVRATTATRVNSTGLIEASPYNLLSYSELITNASWSNQQVSITLELGLTPLNTPIFKFLATGTFPLIFQNVLSIGSVYSSKILVKKGNSTYIQFRMADSSYYNFDTNTFGGSNSSKMSSQLLDNGWVLLSIDNYIATQVFSDFSTSNQPVLGSAIGDFCFISFYQTNSGSPKQYLKTTNRLNVPRLDYTNSTCPSILVEPQRANLVLRSEEFENAYWVKTNSAAITNQIIAPNGTLTADKLNETAINGYHIFASGNVVSGTYTSSVFVKKGERNFVMLWNGGVGSGRYFNIDNGTLGGTLGVTPLNSTIENFGNGWFRCSITNNNVTNFSVYNAISSTSSFYLGEAGKGIYAWGTQVEAGAYTTSYIPTTSAAITRNLDALSLNNLQTNSILSNNWTIFLDYTGRDNYNNNQAFPIFGLRNTTSTDLIGFRRNSASLLSFEKKENNGATVTTGSGVQVTNNNQIKVLIKCELNNVKAYINGTLAYTTTFANPQLMTILQLLTIQNEGSGMYKAKSTLAFKTALTDQECIQLTTI